MQGPINYVKGPINYVKGPVGAVILKNKKMDKTIAILMDIHLPLDKQTACDKNTRSNTIDIVDYLNDILKKDSILTNNSGKNNIIDFFLEIQPHYLSAQKHLGPTENHERQEYQFGERYFDRMAKFFRMNFFYDPSSNKVKLSPLFPNVRFHYLDIRSYLMLYEVFDINEKTVEFVKTINIFKKEDLLKIKDGLSLFASRIKFIFDTMFKNTPILNRINIVSHTINDTINYLSLFGQKNYNIKLKNLLDKILYGYNNKDVQKVVQTIVKNVLNNDFAELFEDIDYTLKIVEDSIKFLEEHSKIDNMVLKNILLLDVVKMNDQFLKIISQITDLYFLRRLLDKGYITKALIYSGLAHSLNIIFILVKYFDFNIQFIAEKKHGNSVSQIEQKIKKMDNYIYPIKNIQQNDIMAKHFLKKNLNQCLDLTGFEIF